MCYGFKTKLSLSSDNVLLVLETLTDLYDNLVCGKTTMQEVELYVELQVLWTKLDTNPDTFQLKYLTAKLWMEYMKIVNIVRAIIRSEQIVKCSLHQGTPQDMLTCLTAYCHLHRVPIRVPKVDDWVGRHVSYCSQAVHPRSACCQDEKPILDRVVRIPC